MEMLGFAITALGVLLTIFLWLVKPEYFFDFFKSQNVTGFIESKKIQDNYTIAIVDDELDSYPITYIQNLGYMVKTYESVSFSQANELSGYDLILLDVKGVVKEDLDEGGAKLIKIIKDSRPLVPIIAVSSGYFHTELNDYFKTCNDSIKKPIDEYRIREMIIELKLRFYDANNIAKTINSDIQLLQVSNGKKKKLSLLIIKYLKGDIEVDELKVYLHRVATIKTDDILCNVEILKDRLKNA